MPFLLKVKIAFLAAVFQIGRRYRGHPAVTFAVCFELRAQGGHIFWLLVWGLVLPERVEET